MKKICISLIFVLFHSTGCITNKFSLITTLYNEKHEERIKEFITCIDMNLANECVDEIHVIYDTSKDDSENKLLCLLRNRKVYIHNFLGRPSYGYCFELAKNKCKNSRIIIANGDIHFNDSLQLLCDYDLTKKFLALTRWNVSDKGVCSLHKDEGSQDVWIFQLPLPQFKNDSMQMGIPGCDNAIAYRAAEAGLTVLNPCHSIQSFHLGSSNIRTWRPNITVPGPYLLVKHSAL